MSGTPGVPRTSTDDIIKEYLFTQDFPADLRVRPLCPPAPPPPPGGPRPRWTGRLAASSAGPGAPRRAGRPAPGVPGVPDASSVPPVRPDQDPSKPPL